MAVIGENGKTGSEGRTALYKKLEKRAMFWTYYAKNGYTIPKTF
jgi:hypothetical protein